MCPFFTHIIFFHVPFQVNESLKRGDHQGAVRNSNIAKWLNVLAIISGLPLRIFIFYAIFYLIWKLNCGSVLKEYRALRHDMVIYRPQVNQFFL